MYTKKIKKIKEDLNIPIKNILQNKYNRKEDLKVPIWLTL